MLHYNLAQINVGRMVAPADSPVMAGFMRRLPEINALADASEGFVWRLQTTAGDATAVQAYADPMILVNVSVWESVEALKAFSYKTAHAQVLRQRGEWFERATAPHMALWWIPAGHIPAVDECTARLEFLRQHGPTRMAFIFGQLFPAWDQPEGLGAAIETGVDGRRLRAVTKDPNGDADQCTMFRYRQEGARVWATYDGGRVRFGSLTGLVTPEGHLDIRYHHVDPSGKIRTGWCRAVPSAQPDGRMVIHETWQWTNGNCLAGSSVLAEIDKDFK